MLNFGEITISEEKLRKFVDDIVSVEDKWIEIRKK